MFTECCLSFEVYIIEIITAGGRGGAVTRTGFLPAPGRDQRVSTDNYPGDERRDKMTN